MPAATRRSSLVLAVLALALVARAAPAEAGRHNVTAGQTLANIAERYQCSVASLRRANRLRGSRIVVGQTLAVPSCGKRVARRSTTPAVAPTRRIRPDLPTRRPKVATPARRPRAAPPAAVVQPVRAASLRAGDSIGKPWHGRLHGGVRLPQGKGYLIRRPLRTWGTPETVATVRNVLGLVRAAHTGLHVLAIGDLSQKGGGRITEHRSHQSGRDIDIGFFYTTPPPGYPESFAVGTADNLDRAATWDLLTAFARTADDPDGVEAIFLDYGVQGLLYDWAKAKGVDERYLDRLFQYPEGHGGTGLVRHEPHHNDHMHVRFRCPAGDANCK